MTRAPDLAHKEHRLRASIQELARDAGVMVALSGGADSSLLLWETVQALGRDKVTAVTVTSPTSWHEDEQSAATFAGRLGVRHRFLDAGECEDPDFLRNTEDRCYRCKKIRYESLRAVAREEGAAVILDGTQADDDPLQRPGMRALKELAISAPLAEANIGKQEIRDLLWDAGFPRQAGKRSEPCLATRIPHGVPITQEALDRVKSAERALSALGLEVLRVRDHWPIARIVTDGKGLAALTTRDEIRDEALNGLKKIGYAHITVDLEAYGS
jgi:uncharacterized protein